MLITSIKWRTEPDGMVTFTLRLPPLLAGALIAFLTAWVMTNRPKLTHRDLNASADAPTVAQQHADALPFAALTSRVSAGPKRRPPGPITTEIILHVRGDGVTLDDGTPITPFAALTNRVSAEPKRRCPGRVPTTRQKRLVKERDRNCRDCGRSDLLEYDHAVRCAH